MPVTRTCTFCGNDIEPGTGKMYIRKDGTIHFFCSGKCQKNMLKLGRIGRRVRWTRRYVKAIRIRPSLRVEAPVAESVTVEAPLEAESREAALEAFLELPGVGPLTAEALWEAGYTSMDQLKAADKAALTEVKGIGPSTAEKILAHLREAK